MTRLVLTGARVVVGDGSVREATTVVVDGQRIASVAPDADGTGPTGGPRPDPSASRPARRTSGDASAPGIAPRALPLMAAGVRPASTSAGSSLQ